MASPGSFDRFPSEIRHHILEELCSTCRLEHQRTAAYASVCLAWQTFFEAKHFARLVLTVPRIADFGVIVVENRRQLVRHIRLDIEFNPLHDEGKAFAYSVGRLFDILSTWDGSTVDGPRQLVLELWTCDRGYRPARHRGCRPRPNHVYPPSLSTLPAVNAVTTLLLRRNDCHIFRPCPDALRQLLRNLPALDKIGYEWRDSIEYPPEVEHDQVYEIILENLPTSVTELVVFEEVRDGFSPADLLWGPPRVANPSLGLLLSRESRQLQHLSASFFVDARHFFQSFWPQASTTGTNVAGDWAWSRLETLALTSKLLTSPRQSAEDINYLLEAASLAVRRMPKLETLEIWNGNGNEHACFFRYSYDSGPRTASLTWKGTWAVDITHRTALSWRETVREKTGFEAEIQVERLRFIPPLMTEAVARFLDLRDRVATDRSLAFMRHLPYPY